MLVGTQRADCLDDKQEPALGDLGLLDHQFLAVCLLTIDANECFARQRTMGRIVSTEAAFWHLRPTPLSLLQQSTNGGELLSSQLFLCIGLRQCALGTLIIGTRNWPAPGSVDTRFRLSQPLFRTPLG